MTLSSQLEAILFIEGRPMTITKLAKVLQVTPNAITTAVTDLAQQYQQRHSGLHFIVTNQQVELTTAPDLHDVVTTIMRDERTGELTRPALETLAIIAYRSPVTKAELEMIRGINCSLIIRNLLMRGLIEELPDKTKGVSVYDVTPEYLQLLGVSSVQDLPDYQALNRDINLGEHLAMMEQPGEDFFKALQ
ncbi:MAG: SMC-Scp complex subunit ScpB [Candidatus Kerfeldbacteria bacterium]|nr:SMC-Scp complex subunit ScpB [Candidatus Kerfeldbacteria bacterium]